MSRLPLAVVANAWSPPELVRHAEIRAAEWALPFLLREEGQSVEKLLQTIENIVFFRGDGVSLLNSQGAIRFTPGMAMLRLKRMEEGLPQPDHLLKWGEIRSGDSVLDCTMGLAQDTLVLARAVGPNGKVVGIERSLAIFAVVSEGLSKWPLSAESCPIETRWGDSHDLLSRLPDRSFDVVFFDPMFERPRRSAPAFELLREHACRDELNPMVLEQARRVARRWVVIKWARYSKSMKAFGVRPLPASRSSPVVWTRLPSLN